MEATSLFLPTSLRMKERELNFEAVKNNEQEERKKPFRFFNAGRM